MMHEVGREANLNCRPSFGCSFIADEIKNASSGSQNNLEPFKKPAAVPQRRVTLYQTYSP